MEKPDYCTMIDERDIDRDDIVRWLREATEGLPPAECDRIRYSLEEHLADVRAREREESLSKTAMDEVYEQAQQRRIELGLTEASPLSRWIATATRGLCNDARHRVKQEIRAHFTDAIEAALEQGLSREEAYSAALGGLGDPVLARRQYRRVYITIANEKRLQKLGRSVETGAAERIYNLILLPLLILSGTMEIATRIPLYSFAFAAWFAPTIAASAFVLYNQWRGIPTLYARGYTQKALATYGINAVIWSALFYELCFFSDPLGRYLQGAAGPLFRDSSHATLACLGGIALLSQAAGEWVSYISLSRKLGEKDSDDSTGLA